MSEDKEADDVTRQTDSGKRMELLKIALEFVSRGFYPAILVVVIVLLQPALAKIDIQALIDRLQSANLGGYGFTFDRAQEAGANTAELNGKIAGLERSLSLLTKEIESLQSHVDTVPVTKQATPPSDEDIRFKANANHTVLVFHSEDGRDSAASITDALLGVGFKSSRTETDFSELSRTHPPGSIFVTHSKKGEAALTEIRKLLEQLGLSQDAKIQARSTNLHRGDVQILVF